MENAFGQPQNVVVLGGSSDIARAITKKLCAARAHTVILAGRNQTLLDEAAREALDYGASKTDTVLFDAEDVASARDAVASAFAKAGDQVDLVVMAVGLLGDQVRDQSDVAAATRMMSVNLTWPVAALTEVRNRLVAQGSGRILVMSSVGAVRVRSSAYLYGGAKAGLDRLCQGLADSLEGTGVTLQLVRPGAVRTRMTEGLREVPFTTGVNQVADTVIKGLSKGEAVIWSPPILKYVYAVLRHLPRPVWRKVMDR
ncbi:MAG: SDR family NAD(P)-dependent oxidoreductase [Actinomycetota bacterium]|jgi:decaprenylphospho-beta-D-erythro-pentofuranosid-2-ulose 2-reductase|nr:SDR family NAD(P)-dependent oxidoreductase [Actinomycetota bacterium]